jgi:hypothetical protein
MPLVRQTAGHSRESSPGTPTAVLGEGPRLAPGARPPGAGLIAAFASEHAQRADGLELCCPAGALRRPLMSAQRVPCATRRGRLGVAPHSMCIRVGFPRRFLRRCAGGVGRRGAEGVPASPWAWRREDIGLLVLQAEGLLRAGGDLVDAGGGALHRFGIALGPGGDVGGGSPRRCRAPPRPGRWPPPSRQLPGRYLRGVEGMISAQTDRGLPRSPAGPTGGSIPPSRT